MILKRISYFLHWLLEKLQNLKRGRPKNTLLDTVKLSIFGLKIEIARQLPADSPHELTVVVPRAEFRNQLLNNDFKKTSAEVLLNSITIAHSPRFEPRNP